MVEKRELTEEEIAKLKQHDKIFIIGTYLVLLVLIVLLVWLWFHAEGFDGAKCLTDPCNFCMEKFKEVTCTSLFK